MAPQGNSIAKAKLTNGIEIEIREIPGFGKKSEVGIFIEEQCASSFNIDSKRNGFVEIKPSIILRSIKLKQPAQSTPQGEKTSSPPSLADITNRCSAPTILTPVSTMNGTVEAPARR